MAAITPALEQLGDTAITSAAQETLAEAATLSEAAGNLDAAQAGTAGGLDGLAELEHDESVLAVASLAADALDTSHAGLVTLAFTREAVAKSLVGAHFRVVAQAPNKVRIVLDRPIQPEGEFVAPWCAVASPTARSFGVLSWTSKMGTPSFSLPAGSLHIGGTCRGALAGQSIVPAQDLYRAAHHVRAVLGKPVRLQQAVCQYCYATGGQYMTGQVQFAQVLRHTWVQQAMRDPALRATWIETMIYAIDNAEYRLAGGKVNKTQYAPERYPGRYFRIHDSGDFFSFEYLRAWKEIARALPDITFWAPTRIWASPGGVDAVAQINDPPENLVIRPSSFHTNEAPPTIDAPGWARGAAVYGVSRDKAKTLAMIAQGAAEGAFDFPCAAYAVDDTTKQPDAEEAVELDESGEPVTAVKGKTCRNGEGPDGAPGCRVCWRDTNLVPLYAFH